MRAGTTHLVTTPKIFSLTHWPPVPILRWFDKLSAATKSDAILLTASDTVSGRETLLVVPVLHSRQDRGGIHGQPAHSHTGGLVYGVGHGGHRWNQASLAHTSHTEGVARVRHLDQHRVYHGQVEGSRHAIVQEGGGQHPAVVIEVVLLSEGPADSLDGAALYLALRLAGVDRLPHVLQGCESQYVDLARVGVEP